MWIHVSITPKGCPPPQLLLSFPPRFAVQDAMQRGGLLPLHFFMQGRSEAGTRFLDLACGTGRYLTFVRDNYPHMQITGVRAPPVLRYMVDVEGRGLRSGGSWRVA